MTGKHVNTLPANHGLAWYESSGPSYAGLYFYPLYLQLVIMYLPFASFGLVTFALGISAVIAFLLFLIPGYLGFETRRNLYLLSEATFGKCGAVFIPSIAQAIAQIVFFAIKVYLFADVSMRLLGLLPRVGTPAYILLCVGMSAVATFVSVKGAKALAVVSWWIVPPIAILLGIAAIRCLPGLALHVPWEGINVSLGLGGTVNVILGFLGTGLVAGADFGCLNRQRRDIVLGGIVGIGITGLVAGLLALVIVAGTNGLFPDRHITDLSVALETLGGITASLLFLIFAVGLIPSTVYSAFLYTNIFCTYIPGFTRAKAGIIGSLLGLLIAVTGKAKDFGVFISILGSTFYPVLGVMMADYFLAGKKWSGSREGFNPAGWLAWLPGFATGLLVNLPLLQHGIPTCLVSLGVSFLSYVIIFWLLAILSGT